MNRRMIYKAFDGLRPDVSSKKRMLDNILSDACADCTPGRMTNLKISGKAKWTMAAAIIMVALMGAAVIYGSMSRNTPEGEAYTTLTPMSDTENHDADALAEYVDAYNALPEVMATNELNELGEYIMQTDDAAAANTGTGLLPGYELYNIRDEETAAAADAICEKHGLALRTDFRNSLPAGKVVRFINAFFDESVLSLTGGRAYPGYGSDGMLYATAGGSFNVMGMLNIADLKSGVDFELVRAVKGYLEPPGYPNEETILHDSWLYDTAAGQTVWLKTYTLSYPVYDGRIFETDRSSITAVMDNSIITFEFERTLTPEVLEALADAIDFAAIDACELPPMEKTEVSENDTELGIYYYTLHKTEFSIQLGDDPVNYLTAQMNGSIMENAEWSVSDESILKLSVSGGIATVTPVSAGTVTLSVKYGEASASCTVYVIE